MSYIVMLIRYFVYVNCYLQGANSYRFTNFILLTNEYNIWFRMIMSKC